MSLAPRLFGALCVALALAAPPFASAKDITLPPSGDNQFSSVTQGIGLVRVTIDYSSPDVHAPNGKDPAVEDFVSAYLGQGAQ